jgi:hypothetical protein
MTPERFAALASLLDRVGAPAMIVGGVAVSVHGRPRMTLDADVTIALDVADLPRVLEAATACGFSPRVESPREFTEATRVLPLRLTRDRWELDLIFAGTPYELEAIARAASTPLGGVDLPIISAADLLVHKILAGRPRDLEDAESIVLRQGGKLDRRFVRDTLLELAAFLADDDLRRRVDAILPQHPASR